MRAQLLAQLLAGRRVNCCGSPSLADGKVIYFALNTHLDELARSHTRASTSLVKPERWKNLGGAGVGVGGGSGGWNCAVGGLLLLCC